MNKLLTIKSLLFKGIIILLISLYSTPSIAQEKINWMSFEEAIEKSEKKSKHIFIDVYTDWCGWCKRMDATTFVDPEIVKLMNKHFYAVKLDAERTDTVYFQGSAFVNTNPTARRSSHQLAQALLKGKMSYPSFVFLNSDAEWLTVVNGYVKSPDLEKVLTYFGENIYKTKDWEQFTATFVSNIPPEEEE
jgi:thioredoxin-related protein